MAPSLKREAAILVLGEICEAIVKYLSKTNTTFVSIDQQLVENLAMQMGLSNVEIRVALESTAARQSANTPLSATLKSSMHSLSSMYGNRATPPYTPDQPSGLSQQSPSSFGSPPGSLIDSEKKLNLV